MEFETKLIHAGFNQESETGATSLPIYETASFAYKTAQELADVFEGKEFGYIYSRIANPTVVAYENRINALENGKGAIATSSGMAAITTVILALTNNGDEIISSRSLFGGTLELFGEVLENHGVKINYVEALDKKAFQNAINDKTKAIFVETLGNPKLDIPDIEGIAKICKVANIPLVADSTLTTPYLFAAKKLEVSIVVHSSTKYLNGNGSAIGGVLVDLGNFNWKQSRSEKIKEFSKKAGEFAFLAYARKKILQNIGACQSPFNAFLQNLGLETLSLRMEKHCENAQVLADALKKNKKIKSINYPGPQPLFKGKGGGLLTFRLSLKKACFNFIDNLKLAKNLANLGDAKTLVIHPESTIYHALSKKEQEAAGVYDDLIRVSVGIESPKDIIEDFEQALEKV